MANSPLAIALYSETPEKHFSTVLGRAIGYSLLIQEEQERAVNFEEVKRLLTELGSESLTNLGTIKKLIKHMKFDFDISTIKLENDKIMQLFWDANIELEGFWESDIPRATSNLPKEKRKELLIKAFQDEMSLVDGYREQLGYKNLNGVGFSPEGQTLLAAESANTIK